VDVLSNHLRNVANKESVKAEDEALTLIANAAEGSVRDALSLLDQAIAHSDAANGIRTTDVRDMLGMNDKSQLFSLFKALLGGEMEALLKEYHTLHASGADPAMLLQDLLGLVHFVTRVKLTKDALNDITFSESERNFAAEMASTLSMTTLSRLWQMILKGLQETRIAPNPSASAEMTLIRIAHAADMPPPSELIRTLRNQQTTSMANTTAPAPAPRSAPVSLITTQQTVAHPAPVAQPSTIAMPENFAETVALFEAKRENLLHQYLMRQTRLVRFEKGRIEINANEVPMDFAGRVGKCLSDWTGQRWLVAISREQGEDTLQSRHEVASRIACEQATSHPLVKAVMDLFPGTAVTKIISKEETTS
jgi:DNA polymerase-3 subunit gamma/tau